MPAAPLTHLFLVLHSTSAKPSDYTVQRSEPAAEPPAEVYNRLGSQLELLAPMVPAHQWVTDMITNLNEGEIKSTAITPSKLFHWALSSGISDLNLDAKRGWPVLSRGPPLSGMERMGGGTCCVDEAV
jgi:hypothetical protein